jgi:hypothetical protein
MEFNRQTVREKARREIMAGKPKEDVFRDIYSSFNDPRLHEPIARIVQYIPEPARIRKYGPIHTLFMLLLAAICIALILMSEYLSLVIPLIFLYLVVLRQIRHYKWITFYGGLLLIISGAMLIIGDPGAQEKSFLTFGLTVLTGVIFILLGIFMPKLLTPDYKTVEETTTNPEGKIVTYKKPIF